MASIQVIICRHERFMLEYDAVAVAAVVLMFAFPVALALGMNYFRHVPGV